MEGPISRLHTEIDVENHQGIDYSIENRLGIFALVNGLIDTCAEGRHVRNGQHRAGNLAIASGARGYSQKKMPIAVAHLKAAWCSLGNHLRTKSVDVFRSGQNARGGSAYIGGGQAQHRHRGAIDAGNGAIAADYYDREIDCIQDVHMSGRGEFRSRSIVSRNTRRKTSALRCHLE